MTLQILNLIFITSGFALIIKSYTPLLKKTSTEQSKTSIKQGLEILSSSSDSAKKARAIINLINLSYILVPTLTSTENYYDDEIQHYKFKQSLTPELLARLNQLD